MFKKFISWVYIITYYKLNVLQKSNKPLLLICLSPFPCPPPLNLWACN